MRLLYHEYNEEENFVEAIDINSSNFHINTGLYLKNKTVQEIITQFLFNSVLHNVGLLWIISSKIKLNM